MNHLMVCWFVCVVACCVLLSLVLEEPCKDGWCSNVELSQNADHVSIPAPDTCTKQGSTLHLQAWCHLDSRQRRSAYAQHGQRRQPRFVQRHCCTKKRSSLAVPHENNRSLQAISTDWKNIPIWHVPIWHVINLCIHIHIYMLRCVVCMSYLNFITCPCRPHSRP